LQNPLINSNFIGSVRYAAEDEGLYGKIEGVNDLVSFEGESTKELIRSRQTPAKKTE